MLSRLTTDTTLVQTVVGSSLSMGLRNTGDGHRRDGDADRHQPGRDDPGARDPGAGRPAVALYFGRRVRGLSRASQDRIADSSAIAAEVLNAVPVVQSYLQEEREADRFAASTERAFGTAARRSRMRSFLVAFIISATFGALLWGLVPGHAGGRARRHQRRPPGQTVVYVIILVSSVAVLSEVYGDLLRAAGATERLMELLQMESPIVTPAAPQPLATPVAGASVRFDDVTFRYPSRPQHPTLAHFNLAVAPGETVALVGPSGAGKSTVLQLILRFYDVESGAVKVDGERVDRVALDALRGRIGIVPQDSVIFSTDAMENIRYGRPDASDDEVIAAARGAFAHDFISALPEGYQTFLGERGVRLSGGQRQRISIARAMLKNAPLLLLDEATSALDAEGERMVQAALESAMRDRTTIVIAHRLSTVQRADRIVVLEAGRDRRDRHATARADARARRAVCAAGSAAVAR